MRGIQHYIKRISQSLKAFGKCDRGAVLVEFAIMLPVFLLTFAVIFEGGRMLWSYQATAAGVRDASRYLARISPETICVNGGGVAGEAGDLLNIVRNACLLYTSPSPRDA